MGGRRRNQKNPQAQRRDVLQKAHEFGHFGRRRTIGAIRERYYWPGLQKDAKIYCLACEVCGRRGGKGRRMRAPLQNCVSGVPFERVAIDLLGPLPQTSRGNKYIVVAIDYFTKWPEAFPVPDVKAETIAQGLVETVISRFGVPREIHSDQGTCFEAAVFQEVMKLLQIQKTRTTPLHPQSNGLVERFNRTLWSMLSKVVSENQKDWDKWLPCVLLAYRATEHSTTGFTPAELNLGRTLTLPVHLLAGTVPGMESKAAYAQQLQEQLTQMHSLARAKLLAAADEAKRRYDVKAVAPRFQIGDRVWCFWPRRTVGRCPKLQCPWVGPCVVVKPMSDVVFRIKPPTGRPRVVHADRMVLYSEEKGRGDVRDAPVS